MKERKLVGALMASLSLPLNLSALNTPAAAGEQHNFSGPVITFKIGNNW